MATRIYLTGRLSVETPDGLLDERRFPGRQGPLAFAYLVAAAGQPVERDQLAEVLWNGEPPTAWSNGLNALLSKIRGLVAPHFTLDTASGCVQLMLPPGTWVDLFAAEQAVHEAESAARSSDPQSAWGPANVAAVIGRRPLLPGHQGSWVESRRRQHRDVLIRALDCLAGLSFDNGELALALRTAMELCELEPFRESSYRRVMRVHLATGNRAQALRVFDRCRRLLGQELGVAPDAQTQQLYERALGTTRSG